MWLKQGENIYVTDILLISLAMGWYYNRVKGMCKVI